MAVGCMLYGGGCMGGGCMGEAVWGQDCTTVFGRTVLVFTPSPYRRIGSRSSKA